MLPLYQLQASNNFLYKYNKKSEIPWRRKFLDKVSGRRDGKISENCFCAVAERIWVLANDGVHQTSRVQLEKEFSGQYNINEEQIYFDKFFTFISSLPISLLILYVPTEWLWRGGQCSWTLPKPLTLTGSIWVHSLFLFPLFYHLSYLLFDYHLSL